MPSREGTEVPQIHSRLKWMILSGRLAPGERLSQYVLADQLQTGRTPIREALRILQTEGLVDSQPKRSFRVAAVSLEDLEDLYVQRVTLEATALRLTVASMTTGTLAELEGMLTQMDHLVAGEEFDRAVKVHAAFHALLVGGAGPRMRAAMRELFNHSLRYMTANTLLAPDRWEKRQLEHRRVVDALHARDTDRAVAELTRHYMSTVRTVFVALDPDRECPLLMETVRIVAPPALDAW